MTNFGTTALQCACGRVGVGRGGAGGRRQFATPTNCSLSHSHSHNRSQSLTHLLCLSAWVGGWVYGRPARAALRFKFRTNGDGKRRTVDSRHATRHGGTPTTTTPSPRHTVYTHDTTRGHEDVAYKWLRQLLVVKEGIVERTFWTAGDASPTEQRINFGLLHVV